MKTVFRELNFFYRFNISKMMNQGASPSLISTEDELTPFKTCHNQAKKKKKKKKKLKIIGSKGVGRFFIIKISFDSDIVLIL